MAELFGTSLPAFLIFTVVIMGGAAYLTGQAVAATWRPPVHLVLYGLLLTLTDRFLVWSLFGGDLMSLAGFALDGTLIGCVALIGYRLTHVTKMVRQYPWLYERLGVWRYRPRAAASG
jgi:hypothetical protein